MSANETKTVTSTDEEQLVVFRLGTEFYGVAIEVVNTIIRFPQITLIPHAPDYMEGVINLRGSIVPVIDLRKRLNLPEGEITRATRVMIVEYDRLLVGMVVDAVTETMLLPMANIEQLPPMVTTVDASYLRGVGKAGDRLITLLALDQIFQFEEVTELSAIAA